MALVLLRHTQPDIAPGVCYGQTDLDVASTFDADAARVLADLPSVSRIVSSPLMRCRKLAEFIAQARVLGMTEDPRLMEMDFGCWEGKAWSEIPRPEIDAWADDFFHARPHGGESVAALTARTRAALSDWRDETRTTLIVTHAGVIRAAHAQGETAEAFSFPIDFGEHVRLP
ncbi:MAG: alpha-ribazole phosphatase [Pseudomonadota bacterium]|mgnify:CR=1 FL=1